jgi:hypothetical protein
MSTTAPKFKAGACRTPGSPRVRRARRSVSPSSAAFSATATTVEIASAGPIAGRAEAASLPTSMSPPCTKSVDSSGTST